MKTKKSEKNSESNFVKIIKEICNDESIQLLSFSYDWIFRLEKDGLIRHILGYQFDLNTAAVQSICKDKCATSDILLHSSIPCVEHLFFMSPSSVKYLGEDGSWKKIIQLFEKHQKIVCKPNEGTGGNNVFVATNQTELEYAVGKIFNASRSMAICPFYNIQSEYRVIVLDNQVKLIFSKEIPHVVGDGNSTLAELALKFIVENKLDSLSLDFKEQNIQTIFPQGEVFNFNWKHNLGQGASPVIISDSIITDELTKLAVAASNALNVKFASIDIVSTDSGYRILEINSGVMMEHFSSLDDKTYEIAKSIYKEAINMMFKQNL